uniref:SET domain-containing protein n=1 Tax=Tetradesmus obliquus TaxID=3088 RepID=A0A383V998_TETOB|eukprot:jgi/Sobl393_1/12890/SZX61174.1
MSAVQLSCPPLPALRTGHRRAAIRCQAVTTADKHSTASAVLGWATCKDLRYEQQPVQVQQHPQYGRCLVAVQDIAADEVLLSVPTDRVFASQAADDLQMHWAAEMGLRLLQERHAHRHSSSSSSSSSGGFWGTWVDSLPASVVTPVEFTAAEVQQLVMPSAVQAVLNMRACLEDCYCEMEQQLQQIDCGWQDFLWAVQVLHSRCFFEPTSQRHLAVPGIDMCNHSSTAPNASVRMLHSPGACQGLAALEEVAPAVAAAACGSYFQLLAGPEGIAAGQQVCISYGSWPAEPFLLLFGFVPQPNPFDCITLFSSMQHMADCYLACCAAALQAADGSSSDGAQQCGGATTAAQQLLQSPAFSAEFKQQVERIEQKLLQQQEAAGGAAGGPGGFHDLIVNASGVDGRLSAALSGMHEAVAAAAAAVPQSAGGISSRSAGVLQDGAAVGAVAAAVQQLQLPLGVVLLHRLQQVTGEIEQKSSSSSSSSASSVLPQACTAAGGDDVEDSSCYEASAAHTELIQQYCSSKAALARQLIVQYGVSASA